MRERDLARDVQRASRLTDAARRRATSDRSDTGVSTEWIRHAEEATGELLTNGTLMQRAAAGLAKVVAREVRERSLRNVVVLVGPGNNGGDALFAARDLACEFGVRATVVLAASRTHDEGLVAVREAGLVVLQHPQEDDHTCGAECCDGPESLKAVAKADLVVDGILGIGARTSPPGDEAPWTALVDVIPRGATVIAVDCPTPGVRADRTVTFGAMKTSLMLDPGAAGEVSVVDIGLDRPDVFGMDSVRLSVRQLASQWPQPGPKDHKYTRGVVGMATGSDAFPGAAVLGCVAALTAGPGMVRYVGPQRAADAVTAAAPEATRGSGRVQAWVVGSGIDGEAERAVNSARYESAMQALQEDVPVVIDAGALTWLDAIERPAGGVTVLTPHAGELASALALLGISAEGDEVTRPMIEADPVRWARRMADVTGYVVLLKGGATVVAAPRDKARLRAGRRATPPPVFVENRSPNWLATAGTGDVLAGLLGVALAAGIEAQTACAVAAYLHGRAAHLANPGGPVRALDVATHVGRAIAEMLDERRRLDEPVRPGCG